MSPLSFRNRNGDLVDVPSVPATRFKNDFGAVVEQAVVGGAVAITKHSTPRAVLLSYDEFRALTQDSAPPLDELDAEFDALLDRMQTEQARSGMAAAFDATPEELGRAAVAAAKPAAETTKPRRR